MQEVIGIQRTVPFVIVERDLLLNESLSIYEKMAYCVLCAYANIQDKTCFPSYQTIANKVGCSRRKVIAVIVSLEKKGLIEKAEQIHNGKNISNLYIVKPASGFTECNSIKKEEIAVENVVENRKDIVENSKGAGNSPSFFKESGECDAPGSACGALGGAPCAPGGEYGAPKQESYNNNHLNNNQSSSFRARGREKNDGRINVWKEKIEYSYFQEVMPDKAPIVNNLITCFLAAEKDCENQVILEEVDSCAVMELLDEIKNLNFGDVKNFIAYLKQTVLNYLRKRYAFLHS